MLVWIYRQFDHLADFISRLPLIMIVLAALMGYRFYEVETLFLRVLPMDVPSREAASALIAGVFIFSTIIFMIHAFRIGWGVKAGLVITALVINLYFWDVTTGDWLFKTFISLVIAAFDIGFSYLFHDLHTRRVLTKKIEVLEEAYRTEMVTYQALIDNQKELNAKSQELKVIIDQHTCPHCKDLFPSPKSVNAHKARCKSNPSTSSPASKERRGSNPKTQ